MSTEKIRQIGANSLVFRWEKLMEARRVEIEINKQDLSLGKEYSQDDRNVGI